MSISVRIEVDAKESERFPDMLGGYVSGGDIKDFSEKQLELIDGSDMFPYKVIHKAKINTLGERVIFYPEETQEETEQETQQENVEKPESKDDQEPVEEENVDKEEDKSYHNIETFICGVKTKSGKECTREVSNPDETCWQH